MILYVSNLTKTLNMQKFSERLLLNVFNCYIHVCKYPL